MFSRSKDRSSEERLSSNSQYLGRIFPFSLLREAETQTPASILMNVKVLYQGVPPAGPRGAAVQLGPLSYRYTFLGESLFGSTENPAGMRSVGIGFGHPCSIVCWALRVKVGGGGVGPHRSTSDGDPHQRVSAVAKGRRALPLWWIRRPSAAVNIIPGTFPLLISAA